ncbi:hypothetical protein EBGED10_35230 [Bacillus sp. GeD10]|nr:hypothetical protein EBGED10_35230 [Bacillus sp. GeD10]
MILATVFVRFAFLFAIRQTLLSDFRINNAILRKCGGFLWLFALSSVFAWGFWCDVSICNIRFGKHVALGTSFPLIM